MANENKITYFAETDYRNNKTRFGIKEADRIRHVYVIGKTGTGKSTLLENMAIQDIQNGNGIAFVDPHGKSAELLLDYVPENRINDVLYFAPFDLDYPISFNVMEDVGIDKRHLVANGLMSAFKKIWIDAWSARMEYILNNILLALLEYPEATLLGVNRMLADREYRKMVVDNVSDVSVKAFWLDEFAKYNDRYMQEAGAAIQNKVGQFISNPLIRNIIGQPHSSFDFREMEDNKKIVIINLSKGKVGEANANLLGGMLITKIYLASMSRADVSQEELKKLPNFYLHVDEFQSFANESFANILSEARKYKLNLNIAHQYIEQMQDEVKAAVFGNVGTMIVFRIGANDAKELEKEFAPQFTPEDLVNLGFAQVYLKLLIDGISSQPFSARTMPPITAPPVSYRERIIENSRKRFAKPRAEVEKYIIEWHTSTNKAERKNSQPTNSSNFRKNNFLNDKTENKTENKKIENKNEDKNLTEKNNFKQNNDRRDNFKKNNFYKPFKTQSNEEEFRKAISLNYLKPVEEAKRSIERKKKMSEENVFALREALSEILSETKKNGEMLISNNVSGEETISNKNTDVTETAQNKTEQDYKREKETEIKEENLSTTLGASKKPETEQKEIPEEVLRSVLKVDNKNKNK
ncbi:type IV secretion system DNA-binding domain-containing protein [Patescibacteria group bacterium]|nr:type IV secretion system DNA-binding domain-containing protein [Patescibacteria group bacterium]MBU4115686.1 type IV secretion system DNA-binding domain-containing protein [Patescibacteria group bacterium]